MFERPLPHHLPNQIRTVRESFLSQLLACFLDLRESQVISRSQIEDDYLLENGARISPSRNLDILIFAKTLCVFLSLLLHIYFF